MQFKFSVLGFLVLVLSSSTVLAAPQENVSKALDVLNKIDATRLTDTDQLLMDSAKDKLKLALNELQQTDPLQAVIRDLRNVQSLLGSLIAAPGDVFSRAPHLKSSCSIVVSADLGPLLARLFGVNIGIGGTFAINNAQEVATKYSSLKAEYTLVLGQMLGFGEQVRPIVGASLTWSRSQYVLSQPECISIAGWGYRDQCS